MLALMLSALPHAAQAQPSEITVSLGKTRPPRPVAFPEIRDWKSLKITLVRTPCFGTCPGYQVQIDGAGDVTYDGFDHVAVKGRHRRQVPIQAVRDLYAQFKEADFFWLFDEYAASITDIPGYTTEIRFDGHTKRVLDYGGAAIGMPTQVRDLEKQIDAVAGTAQWFSGAKDRPAKGH